MSFARNVALSQMNIANTVLGGNRQRIFEMTNLFNKPPLGIKKSKTRTKDDKHLDKIRQMPCCVCKKFGLVQRSPTTAHHCIHDRYGSRKTSDYDAVPLCDGHHQALWDNSQEVAIHNNKAKWRALYGPDWSYVQVTQM